jgi:hypothetical protein
MQIKIDWAKPVQLTENKIIILEKNDLPVSIAAKPGVYFFSRVHGDRIEPFYIGRAGNLRRRLKEHLDSSTITEILRDIEVEKSIKKGFRYFHHGYLLANKGPSVQDNALALAERYLIRTALAAGFQLTNKQGTKFQTHQLLFTGSTKYEKKIFGKFAEVPQK